MKVVDFFARFVFVKNKTFDEFVAENMYCENCPRNCAYSGYCEDNMIEWLDEEELEQ